MSENHVENSAGSLAEVSSEASEDSTAVSAETSAETSGEVPAQSFGVPAAGDPAGEPTAGDTAAPRKRLRRGRVAAVSGAVLLLGAVVAGVGQTVVTVDEADRDPGKPTWHFPKAVKDKKPKAATGLEGMLLPYDEGYTRGPDLGEFGSDTELTGRQAAALRKEAIGGLPRTQRRQLEKGIDEQHIKGMVMRSYLSSDPYAVYKKKSFIVSVTLSQMENQRTVREIATGQNRFLDGLGIFRKGPKIEGHKNAGCFLPPKDSDEKLDEMICSAYVGDVLVNATVSGVKPLDSQAVSRFLAAQLDRITDPGEAV
ncbi:hypothetical protein ABT040_04480 [Streptomyces sp. NPDC002688]|uniref:hypothetical protein n=1 Tax=Streptomyces sp. NPDC002688 TaxID=3154423 RepID=UPI0033277395